MTDEQGSGLSRRDLIKRGAVIGGVVWAAPVVQGITSPAHAVDGSPSGGECENFYRFKANWVEGVGFVCEATSDSTSFPNCDGQPEGWADAADGDCDFIELTYTVNGEGEPTSVTVVDLTSPPPCQVVVIQIKGGSASSPNGYCVEGTDGQATLEIPSGGAAISYVGGIICCD